MTCLNPVCPPPKSKSLVSAVIDEVYAQDSTLRLIEPSEEARWERLVQKHHYLKKATMVGETLRYVVERKGRWVALLGWSSAAFHLLPRDHWIGWSHPQRQSRRHFVACNARFVILQEGRRRDLLASRILSQNLARLSQDWEDCYDHPILLVETFVDPQRFEGTCYRAANWVQVGLTKGFARSRLDFYQLHAQPKAIFLYPLHPQACQILRASPLPPHWAKWERQDPVAYPFTAPQTQSLLQALAAVPDPRARKGRRHRALASILAITAAAMLAGNKNYLAIGQFAASLDPTQLRRLRASRDPDTRRYLAPSESTIRRAVQRVDPQALDTVLNQWLRSHELPGPERTFAADGKSVRTVAKINGQPCQLFSLLSHQSHLVWKQIRIPSKTNEIPALKTLLEDQDIAGGLLTVDALHTQHDTASYVVDEKQADYLMTVKANQPKLLETLTRLVHRADFFPSSPHPRPSPRST